MTQSKYSFERTELRVLQNSCEGDNEKFLNLVADISAIKNAARITLLDPNVEGNPALAIQHVEAIEE